MKVLLINGSPRSNGNTFTALKEVAGALDAEGVETEIVSIGAKAVQGCIACRKCAELGRCVFNDGLYSSIWEKLRTADGIVIGSPVYYAGPTVRSVHCWTGSSIQPRSCWSTSRPQRWQSAGGEEPARHWTV